MVSLGVATSSERVSMTFFFIPMLVVIFFFLPELLPGPSAVGAEKQIDGKETSRETLQSPWMIGTGGQGG